MSDGLREAAESLLSAFSDRHRLGKKYIRVTYPYFETHIPDFFKQNKSRAT
jgi:hypothetical protein